MKIWNAIRAAIAAAFSFTWRKCRQTGRWVLECVASIGASPAPPAPMEEETVAEPAVDERLEQIRKAAMLLAAGQRGDHAFGLLSNDQFAWLSTLDQRALCRVACANDNVLRAHMSGKRMIDGVRASDKDSVQAWFDATGSVRRDDEQDEDVSIWAPAPGLGV